MRWMYFLSFLVIMSVVVSCSEEIGVNDFKYQCQSNKECGEGYVCDKFKGCIKRGGVDGGADVIRDVQVPDVEDIVDIVEIADVEDVVDYKDVEVVEDIVLEDITDIEDIFDAVFDDVSDVILEDITDVEDIEDIMDVSDGGIDVQINYVVKMESVYDFSAGMCTSPNYILESVSGFTASDEMKNSQYILHRSMLFKK